MKKIVSVFILLIGFTVTYAQPLTGVYTINGALPPSATNFISFTSAITSLNTNGAGATGATFQVDAGQVFTELPPAIAASGTAAGPIVFQKNGTGANPLVLGTSGVGTTDACISLRGCRFVIFDGIDVADNPANNTNNARMEFGYKIVNSSSTVGASHNVIKNCRIELDRAYTASLGIIQSSSTTAPSGGAVNAASLAGANHNNRYENVRILNCYRGVLLKGRNTMPDSNNVITSANGDTTIVGGSSADDIGNGAIETYGINLINQKNVEVSKCIVRNVTCTGTPGVVGLRLQNHVAGSFGSSAFIGNRIYGIRNVVGMLATGMGVALNDSVQADITNNLVYDIQTGYTGFFDSPHPTLTGIQITGKGSTVCQYNTVAINDFGLNAISSAFADTMALCLLQNNIFANFTGSQSPGPAKHFAITAGHLDSFSSNNIYWADHDNGFLGLHYINQTFSDVTGLWKWESSISQATPSNPLDEGSSFTNPNFISTGVPDFAGPTPAALSGVPVVGVSHDINGNLRDVQRPTIGAIETTELLADSTAPIISNVQIVNGPSPKVTVEVYDNALPSSGVVRLWCRLVGGSMVLPIDADSTPLAGLNGSYSWDTSLLYLPAGNYEFYITARDNVGPGKNIGLSPVPTLSFNGFSASDPPNYLNNPDLSANYWNFTSSYIPPPCDSPISLLVSNITDEGADINWNAVNGSVGYEYVLNQNSLAPGTAGIPISGNAYQATGLLANVTYHFHVRSNCNLGSYSAWSSVPFMTLDPTRVSNLKNDDLQILTAYPNPVIDKMYVLLNQKPAHGAQLQIADETGRIVSEIKVSSKSVTIDFSGLSRGMYFLRYRDNGVNSVLKVYRF